MLIKTITFPGSSIPSGKFKMKGMPQLQKVSICFSSILITLTINDHLWVKNPEHFMK